MKKLEIIGRILFAIPFTVMGLSHFFMTTSFQEMLNNSLIPGSIYAVLLSGAMFIIASIFILINKYVRVACFWIAGLLFLIITTIHIPNLFIPNNFDKALFEAIQDTALLGASIMIAIYLDRKEQIKE